jgi:putative transposase
VQRVYRYRLYPTRRQREALATQLGFACELYNAALEQRRDAWRRREKSVSYHEQSAHEGIEWPGRGRQAPREAVASVA